ncbi:hypothetical protein LCGC14_2128880 [marine sediment metagenome]|uniref:Lipoprotein n=1 Tax=marine sediment metagenome TaxID=412755 RepID=A0A0F9GF22_9ZZZZ
MKIQIILIIGLVLLVGCTYNQKIPLNFFIEDSGNDVENLAECMSIGQSLAEERIGSRNNRGHKIIESNYEFEGIKCDGEKCLCW